MKRIDKKGQFYLIGASMILVIIASVFILPSRSSHGTDFSEAESLVEEIEFESGRVLEFLTYNDAADRIGTITNFTRHYENYSGDFYFVFGNKSEVNFFKHADSPSGIGTMGQDGLPSYSNLGIVDKEELGWRHHLSGQIDRALFEIEGRDYYFTITEGENFHFIVSQKVGRDKFVSVN